MGKLIRQVRSLGSQRKEYGVHASRGRKPEVSFKAPTYLIRGSNFTSTPQGGIKELDDKEGLFLYRYKSLQAFDIDNYGSRDLKLTV